jgi:hypothetical protein
MQEAREQAENVVVRVTTTNAGGTLYYSDTETAMPLPEQVGTEVARRPRPRPSWLSSGTRYGEICAGRAVRV